ncbi:hypothetical protein Acor_84310 [Acrocarpospora corrugata]|uniref:ScoMcrA-like DNA sulfur-binding domain-containing protein n=1 Tax=Acrocarpospora corrugata TaxID=35763 RepID=A0A5M3WE56_9ACTN|nr:hypothetical protein [Acrocarpospora corrugata]GES06362.1 hypothetical protein Acor_84310 [Acrocarpospora corrugata]
MHPYDGDQALNAEFSVEREGKYLALIQESSSGRPGKRRNGDYNRALALLVERLQDRDAVLLDALVDSKETRHLPEEERRIISGPIRLADHPDPLKLRRMLTTPQARIGQSKNSNKTKRIRLRLSVPGYSPDEADQLAHDLAAASSSITPLDGQPEETESLNPEHGQTSAVDVDINAVIAAVEQLNTQKSTGEAKRHQPLTLLWAIGRTKHGQSRMVPWPEAKAEIDRLISGFGQPDDAPNAYLPFLALANTELWELSAVPPAKGRIGDARRNWLNGTTPPITGGLSQSVHTLFTRSTEALTRVVDTLLLLYFDGVDETALLHAVGLAASAASIEAQRQLFLLSQVSDESTPERAPDIYNGVLSRAALADQRGEQAVLRRLLLQGGPAECALCGAELPERFLIAAHIKKRVRCTEHERRDLENIAMLACVLGCDSLYEHGYITVSEEGRILLSKALEKHPPLLDHAHRHLRGRTTSQWSAQREPYFAWHRTKVFLTGPSLKPSDP